MRVCKCSANYGKDCMFPEEYDTVGCTSGEGWWPIEDFYLDDEYWCKMNTLEQEMLEGDDEGWYVFLYEKGSNISFSLGQEFTKEEAISLKQKLEEDISIVVEIGRCGY